MKKKYYRYTIYIVLFIFFGTSLAYIGGVIPFNFRLFFKTSKQASNGSCADSLTVIGLNTDAFNLRLTDPSATVTTAERALTIAKAIGYTAGVAESHRVIGIGYYYQDSIQPAIKNYIEALDRYKKLNDVGNEAKVHNNIGNLYRDVCDPENALKYFRRSLALSANLGDEKLLAGLYFNIGGAYEQKKQYQVALNFFDKSYRIFKRRKDHVYMAMYFQNSGLVHYKLGDFKKAEVLLTTGVRQAKKFKLYKIITGCYLMLSRIYIQRGNYSETEKILGEGIRYALLLKDKEVEQGLRYKQYELQNAMGNYKGALKILQVLFKHDSLLLMKNQSSNILISSQHYLQQQKIQENELIIAKQKYREVRFVWMITLSILIFLLSAVTVLIVYFLKEKRRKRKEILIQNSITSLEQKALQAMMNPHFVFNVMNSIQHFINQADSKTANQILSGFARLARKHLEICMNSTISVQEELVYLQLYLSLEKVRFCDKMDYYIKINKDIDTEEILIPSMLIQPFIENAIWHGIMPKDEGGMIKLNFELDDTDLLISIIDDGIGISNSERIKDGGHISRGMALIRERVNLLNKLNKRHIFIDQHQMGDYGTEVLIRIPA